MCWLGRNTHFSLLQHRKGCLLVCMWDFNEIGNCQGQHLPFLSSSYRAITLVTYCEQKVVISGNAFGKWNDCYIYLWFVHEWPGAEELSLYCYKLKTTLHKPITKETANGDELNQELNDTSALNNITLNIIS